VIVSKDKSVSSTAISSSGYKSDHRQTCEHVVWH